MPMPMPSSAWRMPKSGRATRRHRLRVGSGPWSDKESQRWLSAAQTVSERLSAAAEVIVVGDRESDIYALFSRRPARVELLVRSGQNRALDDGSRLFDAALGWPVLGLHDVQVPPRGPGDRGRVARVALKAGTVVLTHPRNGRRGEDPASLDVTLVEAVEVDAPVGTAPLHWRLLTTLPATQDGATQDGATQDGAAAEIVRLYRLRWRIRAKLPHAQDPRLADRGCPDGRTASFVQSCRLGDRCRGAHHPTGGCTRRQRTAGNRRRNRPTRSPQRRPCVASWRAKPTGNGTDTQTDRSLGSAGSSPGWVDGTATTSLPDRRPCTTDGTASPQSPKDTHWPTANERDV